MPRSLRETGENLAQISASRDETLACLRVTIGTLAQIRALHAQTDAHLALTTLFDAEKSALGAEMSLLDTEESKLAAEIGAHLA